MSDTNNKLLKRVRIFFRKISWRKILTFLFFVLLASIFWVMEIYRQKFEATVSIPVKYVNIPDSIVFAEELPSTINAHIREDGAGLFKYYFTRQNDSLIIDVRKLIQNRNNKEEILQGRNYEQLIKSKLLSTTELLSYSPTRLSYMYAPLHQKKVPVIYDGYIYLNPGYLIDGDLELIPDSVMAYGSKLALDTLKYAHTQSDSIYGITSSTQINVSIKPMKGINFIPNSIQLCIPVDEFTQKEVIVPITCINLPPFLDIKLLPSTVKIPFFVGLRRYNEVKIEDFKVIVDYNDIVGNNITSIPIIIAESPDYIRAASTIPAEVEFILEQNN